MSSFAPATAMLYTDPEILCGISKPVDYVTGIEYGDGILESSFLNDGVGLQARKPDWNVAEWCEGMWPDQ